MCMCRCMCMCICMCTCTCIFVIIIIIVIIITIVISCGGGGGGDGDGDGDVDGDGDDDDEEDAVNRHPRPNGPMRGPHVGDVMWTHKIAHRNTQHKRCVTTLCPRFLGSEHGLRFGAVFMMDMCIHDLMYL